MTENTAIEQRITHIMYQYWEELRQDRRMPSLRDFTPEFIAPYKDNIALIDLRDADSDAILQIIGPKLTDDLDENLVMQPVTTIPRRTMLSRLTDHYYEVLANHTPIAFEAEFLNRQKEKALYRGILLPLSDDGENVHFILGAIRWVMEKDIVGRATTQIDTPTPAHEDLTPSSNDTLAVDPDSARQDTFGTHDHITTPHPAEDPPTESIAATDGVNNDQKDDSKDNFLSAAHSALRDQLAACRDMVNGHTNSVGGSRRMLYLALEKIYTFHLTAEAFPDEYAQLLQENNLKQQKRAPFTTTLKLCFGKDYDKTRLTEYAAAMAHAVENGQTADRFLHFIEQHPGGIKGCVLARRAARQQKRTTHMPVQTLPTDILKHIDSHGTLPLPLDKLPEGEFYALLVRKTPDGIEWIDTATETDRDVSRLLKKTARKFGQT